MSSRAELLSLALGPEGQAAMVQAFIQRGLQVEGAVVVVKATAAHRCCAQSTGPTCKDHPTAFPMLRITWDVTKVGDEAAQVQAASLMGRLAMRACIELGIDEHIRLSLSDKLDP